MSMDMDTGADGPARRTRAKVADATPAPAKDDSGGAAAGAGSVLMTPASAPALQHAIGNAGTAALVKQSSPAALAKGFAFITAAHSLGSTPTNELKRPAWDPSTTSTMKPKKGDHRRHVVMSHKMSDAIWAYHRNSAVSGPLARKRLEALQAFVGETGTLRTLMAKAAFLVHNSLGNLFLGSGGENTAIGFAVRPLEAMAAKVDAANNPKEAVEVARAAVEKWTKQGIFGFAMAHKAYLGVIAMEWAAELDPKVDTVASISGMLRSFADSCAFDVPYEEHETDDGHRDDEFPAHMDKGRAAALLEAQTIVQAVIDAPATPDLDLYGAKALGLLKSVKDAY